MWHAFLLTLLARALATSNPYLLFSTGVSVNGNQSYPVMVSLCEDYAVELGLQDSGNVYCLAAGMSITPNDTRSVRSAITGALIANSYLDFRSNGLLLTLNDAGVCNNSVWTGKGNDGIDSISICDDYATTSVHGPPWQVVPGSEASARGFASSCNSTLPDWWGYPFNIGESELYCIGNERPLLCIIDGIPTSSPTTSTPSTTPTTSTPTSAPTRGYNNILFKGKPSDGNFGTRGDSNTYCTELCKTIFDCSGGYAFISYQMDSLRFLPVKYGFDGNVTVTSGEGIFLADNFEDLILNHGNDIMTYVTNGESYFSGTNADGTYSTYNCKDWSVSGCKNGKLGLGGSVIGCSSIKPFLCFALNATAVATFAPTTLTPTSSPTFIAPTFSPTKYPTTGQPTTSPTIFCSQCIPFNQTCVQTGYNNTCVGSFNLQVLLTWNRPDFISYGFDMSVTKTGKLPVNFNFKNPTAANGYGRWSVNDEPPGSWPQGPENIYYSFAETGHYPEDGTYYVCITPYFPAYIGQNVTYTLDILINNVLSDRSIVDFTIPAVAPLADERCNADFYMIKAFNVTIFPSVSPTPAPTKLPTRLPTGSPTVAPSYVLFGSNITYPGNFAATVNIDLHCQEYGSSLGMTTGYIYFYGNDISARLNAAGFRQNSPVVSINGTRIANNITALRLDPLLASMAQGNVCPSGSIAWTGMYPEGTLSTSACSDFTSSVINGASASCDSKADDWEVSNSVTYACANSVYLICLWDPVTSQAPTKLPTALPSRNPTKHPTNEDGSSDQPTTPGRRQLLPDGTIPEFMGLGASFVVLFLAFAAFIYVLL